MENYKRLTINEKIDFKAYWMNSFLRGFDEVFEEATFNPHYKMYASSNFPLSWD